jgi:hypothetical protein
MIRLPHGNPSCNLTPRAVWLLAGWPPGAGATCRTVLRYHRLPLSGRGK